MNKKTQLHIDLNQYYKNMLLNLTKKTHRTQSDMVRYLIEKEHKKMNNIFHQED